MTRKVINPWDIPPGIDTNHRVIHIMNLPPGSNWAQIKPYFFNFPIEFAHFFGNQALLQFVTSKDARNYIQNERKIIDELNVKIEFSIIPELIYDDFESIPGASLVICVQVNRLRLYLGIYDIYDQCSLFGTVDKIICFEKSGKFALVQMHTIQDAGLALYNLSNCERHNPSFKLRIQFSKNHDIVIKFNNTKSFDFTQPSARLEFEQNREIAMSELGFFEPERDESIPQQFDLFRPVDFDPSFSNCCLVRGFHVTTNPCDSIYALFRQYGRITSVRCSAVRGNGSISLVFFKESFCARMAQYMLQNLNISNDTLAIELVTEAEIPSLGIELSKDYSNLSESYEESYCPPSKYVRITPNPGNLEKFQNSDGKLINDGIAEFSSIENASLFITMNSLKDLNGEKYYITYFEKDL